MQDDPEEQEYPDHKVEIECETLLDEVVNQIDHAHGREYVVNDARVLDSLGPCVHLDIPAFGLFLLLLFFEETNGLLR